MKKYIKNLVTLRDLEELEVSTDEKDITIEYKFASLCLWCLKLSIKEDKFTLTTRQGYAISNKSFTQIQSIIDRHEVIKLLWVAQKQPLSV